jgi:hypothetical protein
LTAICGQNFSDEILAVKNNFFGLKTLKFVSKDLPCPYLLCPGLTWK